MKHILIIGAGQAAGAAVTALRRLGYEDQITILGEEAYPPYERPPLSKSVLSGEAEVDSTYMLSPEELASEKTNFVPNVSATEILRDRKIVKTADGASHPYDRLIIATGGRVRTLDLPDITPERVSYLRSIDDSIRLQQALVPGQKLLVIGGGWIGLEVAATARKLGVDVALAERAERLCARAAPPFLSEYLYRLHKKRGVEIHLNTQIVSATEDSGDIAIKLSDGEQLQVDHILVGIGLIPNSELAEAAGLGVVNGVIASPEGETDDPNIFACGDVTNFRHRRLGIDIRLESWENANCQAEAMAARILGEEAHYDQTPWFWSDQYDVNIQILGLGGEGEPVVRGDPGNGPASLFYLTPDQKLQSVVTINNAKDMAVARRMMERKLTLTPEALQSTPKLKTLLKQP